MYLPKRNFKRRQERKKGSNQAFYKAAQWRKARAAYLSQYPICQVADYFDDIEPGKIVDHIIPISQGGAKYDPRNLQTLSKKIHDIKSTIEGNEGTPLVDYTRNQDGDFIPLNKSDIWKRLEKNYKYLRLTGKI